MTCRTALTVSIFLFVASATARADYVADFSTMGSAADFATFQINATDDGDPSGTGDDTDFLLDAGGGNAFLRAQASPPAGGSGGGPSQLRYQVAPSLFEGAEVAIPTDLTSAFPRTEARLNVTIRDIIGGDDLPIENPFMQFGFTEFDPATNTPDYASKVIVQIDNAFNAGTAGDPHVISISETGNNPDAGNFIITTFDYPGNAYTPGDAFELQLTNNQVRLLLNGNPLTDGGGNSFFNLPTDFFANFFDPGDALIPFFGVIRGPSLEDEDIISAGFDDINARSETVGGNIFNVTVIAANFLESVPAGTLGDNNVDGFVDFADFRIWKDASGFGGGFAEAIAFYGVQVPEPGTLWLIAMAVPTFLWRVRRPTASV